MGTPRFGRAIHCLGAMLRLRPPGPCLLCRRWQMQPVCTACMQRWRPTVPRCARCASPWTPALPHLPCPHCEDPSPEFDRAITALDYVPPWQHLIGQFKFGQWPALGAPLAMMLVQAVQQRPHRVDLVLPVPVSTQRLQERGYNQAWVLARRAAKALNLPARPDVLGRVTQHARLKDLDLAERRKAIRGAFALMPGGAQAVAGRHVALVDDVLTTGATLDEASLVLREAGARGVSVWVLARTPPPGWR